MNMSTVARLNLRHREKVVMKYYGDMGKGKGNCTFGIGTLVHRGPCNTAELATTVTDAQVEGAFSASVRDAERAINRNVTVPLTQAQFDSLVSFTFNRGSTGAYHAFELINAGDMQGAADWITTLVNVTIQKKGKRVTVRAAGLIQRRAEESAPFRVRP